MTDFDDVIEDLKQKRDELRLQMHLASKEIKDEWNELEEKMEDFSGNAKQFSNDAKLKETGAGTAMHWANSVASSNVATSAFGML